MQAELRDIHLPDPVSWWPPAPGWYGVLLLCIFVLLLWLYIRHRRKPDIKTLALHELQQIENAWKHHASTQQLCSDISVLLRRIVISHGPREQLAAITGEAWLAQLHNITGLGVFTAELEDALLYGPYRKHSNIAPEKLLQACRDWIKALPRSRTS